MRTERLFSILIYLLHQEKVTATELATYFEVNKRTIYRDLDILQMSGVPLIAYPGKNGGYALVDSYSLNAFTFTDEEKEQLLTGLAMQKNIIESEKIKLLEQKLQLLKQADNFVKDPYIFQNFSMHQKKVMQLVKQRMSILTQSIANCQQVEIEYISLKGENQKRIVFPEKLLFASGSWYLVAFCTLRTAHRQFKFTRMPVIEILDEKIPEDYRYQETIVEYQANAKQEQLLLKFSKKSLAKLYDYFLPDEIQIGKNEIEVQSVIDENTDISPFIAMFLNDVEIVSPLWLREKYQERIEELLNIYKS